MPPLHNGGLWLSVGVKMATIHDDPAALKALQDDIYREKILRSRRMTMEERLDTALELTDEVFERMLEGALWQLGTSDRAAAEKELRRRLQILGRVHDAGRFVNQRP